MGAFYSCFVERLPSWNTWTEITPHHGLFLIIFNNTNVCVDTRPLNGSRSGYLRMYIRLLGPVVHDLVNGVLR